MEPNKAEPLPVFLCRGSQGQFYHFRDYISEPRVQSETRKTDTGSKWGASVVVAAQREGCNATALEVLLRGRGCLVSIVYIKRKSLRPRRIYTVCMRGSQLIAKLWSMEMPNRQIVANLMAHRERVSSGVRGWQRRNGGGPVCVCV